MTELAIDGLTHAGEGVGRLPADGSGRAGKAVFVPLAVPGETVAIEVVEDRGRWARGWLLEVLEASPHRIEAPCPHAPDVGRPDPRCGGCQLQHVTIDHQRELKRRIVCEQLERIGRVLDPPVAPVRAAGPPFGYRNNARFHADGGRLGFHAPGTHDVVAVQRCPILNDLAQARRDGVDAADVRDEAVVRGHPETGTALTVVDGQVDGDPVLAARVGDLVLRFSPSCFFQVNTPGAEVLVDEVLAAAGPVDGADVWDLYAGVGLFSVPLARRGGRVTSVESHGEASGWAARNAEVAGVRVRTVTEDVERFVARPGPSRPAVVVLDPPRTGAGTDVVRAVAGRGVPRVVYVACEIAPLARDSRALVEAGYRLERVVPIDLFPQTFHIECVASFARAT